MLYFHGTRETVYLVVGTGNPCALHASTTLVPSRLAYLLRLLSVEKMGDLNPTGSGNNIAGAEITVSIDQRYAEARVRDGLELT